MQILIKPKLWKLHGLHVNSKMGREIHKPFMCGGYLGITGIISKPAIPTPSVFYIPSHALAKASLNPSEEWKIIAKSLQ